MNFHYATANGGNQGNLTCFYESSGDRIALASGNEDDVLSEPWAASLVKAFVQSEYPVEMDGRIVERMVEFARGVWNEKVDWQSLKWYIRNKAIAGTRAYFLGVELSYSADEPMVAGFSSGYPGAFMVGRNGNISILGKHRRGLGSFWSGYSPFTGVPVQYSGGTDPFFNRHMESGSRLVLLSHSVALWASPSPYESIPAILHADDPSVFMKNLMRKGALRKSDCIACIIGFD